MPLVKKSISLPPETWDLLERWAKSNAAGGRPSISRALRHLIGAAASLATSPTMATHARQVILDILAPVGQVREGTGCALCGAKRLPGVCRLDECRRQSCAGWSGLCCLHGRAEGERIKGSRDAAVPEVTE